MTTQPHPRPVHTGSIILVAGLLVAVSAAAFGATRYDWGSDDSQLAESTAQSAWVPGDTSTDFQVGLAAAQAEHDNALAGVGIVLDAASKASAEYEAGLAAAVAEHDNAISGAGIVPDPGTVASKASAEYEAGLATAIAEHENAIAGVGIVPDAGTGPTVSADEYAKAVARAIAEHDNAIAGAGLVP